MKLNLLVFIIVLSFAVSLRVVAARSREKTVVVPASVDIEAMLDAIAQVESGNNPKAIGKLGERSAYQIMGQSWAMHSRVPFAQASLQPALARMVARQHLAWMAGVIERNEAQVTPAMLAAAWRWGPGSAFAHTRSESTRRVLNLYFEAVDAKRAAAEGAR